MAAVLLLSGCANADPDASPPAGLTATPTPTLDPFAAATAVDPADFGRPWYNEDPATVDGVDFDSPDHGIHCGIYDPYFPESGIAELAAPFVGCVPETIDFEFPEVVNDGYDYGRATAITQHGTGKSAAVWMSDQEFAQHANVLEVGTSVTWSGVTCASLDGGIRCLNTSSGHGFFISRERYEVEREAPEQFDDEYVQDESNLYFVGEGVGVAGAEWLTPSGNVACAILYDAKGSGTLECRAAEHSWSGSGISITDEGTPQPTPPNEATFRAGQVLAGSSTATIGVLPYGHFVHIGDFRCVSLDTGLTCENWESRHGFTISKSKLETH